MNDPSVNPSQEPSSQNSAVPPHQDVNSSQQYQTTASGMPVPPQTPVQEAPVQQAGAPTAQQAPMGTHAQHASAGYYYQQPRQAPYQSATGTSPSKSSGGAKTFLLAFLGAALAVIIGLSGFGFYASLANNPSSSSTTVLGSSTSTTINADDTSSTLAEAVAKKALPSVANIDVYTSSKSSSNLFGFGGSSSSDSLTESSLGSGVILSEDGYIVTNYHVIEGAEALEVTIGDETYHAEVVGSDPSSDIAVIKAQNASGLTPVEIGNSADLVIGQWVMTIGSPFGLEQSVATGIVSATSRSEVMESTTGGATTVYTNLIQTDAAINPGNSGGALVDANGKLIGINTLITSYSGNYSGVGFAIPVDYATSIAQQIIDGKTPTHAQLGVSLVTVNSSIAQRYGLSVESGAYVSQVSSNSGAEKAGVESGDIITKVNGKSVTSASDLMLSVRSKNPGDKVSLEINRSGETKTFDVTLGSDGETQKSNSKSSFQPNASSNQAAA